MKIRNFNVSKTVNGFKRMLVLDAEYKMGGFLQCVSQGDLTATKQFLDNEQVGL